MKKPRMCEWVHGIWHLNRLTVYGPPIGYSWNHGLLLTISWGGGSESYVSWSRVNLSSEKFNISRGSKNPHGILKKYDDISFFADNSKNHQSPTDHWKYWINCWHIQLTSPFLPRETWIDHLSEIFSRVCCCTQEICCLTFPISFWGWGILRLGRYHSGRFLLFVVHISFGTGRTGFLFTSDKWLRVGQCGNNNIEW